METEKEKINFFAKTNFRNKQVPFGIKPDDRRRHMYVIGKTGMGKTTMMENMVIQDIRNGNGVCFIDPHGDSIQTILDFVPASRINDVVYFNPADQDFPIALNILESVDPKYQHLVASGLMGVFTKIWAGVWSPRMEYILNNTILALLDSPGNTMLGIVRMYVDKKYRKKIVDAIKDPMVKAFWVEEFANYAEKYRTEAVAPIQNKVGQFLSSSIIRNIIGQPKSTIDLREIMDGKKILLMDLSKGKVGEDNSALLGAMIITKLQLAALSRVDVPEADRKDFYLYVDEFQNFVTDSFATILSEARKYRLNLTVGHQYIGQLTPDNNPKVRDAVFGNVGSMVVFRVGAADAEFLETEFEPSFTPVDIVNLPKYHVVLKLMINGIASDPFTAVTMQYNPEWRVGDGQKIIKVSRERYANPRDDVEDKIQRWMGTEFHEASAQSHSSENGELSLRRQPNAPEYQKPKSEGFSNAARAAVTTHPADKATQTNNNEPKPKIQIAQDFIDRVKQPVKPLTATKPLSPFKPTLPTKPLAAEKSVTEKQVVEEEPNQTFDLKKKSYDKPAFVKPITVSRVQENRPNQNKRLVKPIKPANDIWKTVQSLQEDKQKDIANNIASAMESVFSSSQNQKSISENNSKPEPKKSQQDNSVAVEGQTYDI